MSPYHFITSITLPPLFSSYKCNFRNNPLFSFTVCGKYHIYSCGHSPTLLISSVPGELSSQRSTLVNKMSGSIYNLHITVVNHSRNSNHSAVVRTYRIRISTYITLFKAVFSLCSVTLVRNEPLACSDEDFAGTGMYGNRYDAIGKQRGWSFDSIFYLL